jgi:GeoRSP system PqqD family protein
VSLKIFRNPDIMWREETGYREQALEGLEKGDDVEDVGTSVLYLGGTVLSLNILGTEIWKLCDGRTVDEIVASLLQSFEVEPDVLEKDVRSFLQELKEKGFIHYEE